MRTNKLLKLIPLVAGIIALCTTQVKAQTTSTTSGNITKTTAAIKVVDNKGTVKYFQSNNGITQITSTSDGSKTTTTWQLGGTLTDDTYIDATGKLFALDGIELITSAASTNAVSGSKKGDGGPGTGYTLLVRDEATGATKKLLANSLIDGGVGVFSAPADLASGTLTTDAFSGLTTVKNRVSVFRNGIKLVQADWTFDADPTKINITASADLPIYSGDVIEVQWVK